MEVIDTSRFALKKKGQYIMDFLEPLLSHADLWLPGWSHCGALLPLVVLLQAL